MIGSDRPSTLTAAGNLMRNDDFQNAAQQTLARSGANPAVAGEGGLRIYYHPKTGLFYFVFQPPVPGINGLIDFGNVPEKYPGGWVLIGLAHAHPFPKPGLGPPGKQDVIDGQPNFGVPWYVIVLGPNGQPEIYGIFDGTILMPDGTRLNRGDYDFDPDDGAIIKKP
jgi:hypothetical protein